MENRQNPQQLQQQLQIQFKNNHDLKENLNGIIRYSIETLEIMGNYMEEISFDQISEDEKLKLLNMRETFKDAFKTIIDCKKAVKSIKEFCDEKKKRKEEQQQNYNLLLQELLKARGTFEKAAFEANTQDVKIFYHILINTTPRYNHDYYSLENLMKLQESFSNSEKMLENFKQIDEKQHVIQPAILEFNEYKKKFQSLMKHHE